MIARNRRQCLLGVVSAALLVMPFAASSPAQEIPPQFVYVIVPEAPVKSGANVIGTVLMHSRFMVDQENGKFLLIEFGKEKRQQGWLHSDHVLRDPRLNVPQWDRVIAAQKLARQAEALKSQGQYAAALALRQKALPEFQALLGEDHPETADCLLGIADLHDRLGNRTAAEPLFRRCLEIYETKLGKRHILTGKCLNDMAGMYHEQGKYRESEALFRRAMEITDRYSEYVQIAGAVCNNFGNLLNTLGRYAEAEPLFRRSVELAEKKYGKDDPEMATALGNFAVWHAKVGRQEEGVTLLRQALALNERRLGKDHPDLVTQITSLATMLNTLGRYGEADLLFRRGLEICETQLGKDHPQTARTLANSAALHFATGEKEKVEPILRRALDIVERTQGRDHPLTADALFKLGEFYLGQDRHAEAMPLLRRTLAICETIYGKSHSETLAALNDIALAHAGLKQFDEAEKLHRRVLETEEAMLGKDHESVGRSANNLALMYQQIGRYEQAEPLLRRALAINEARAGKDHPNTLSTLGSLGDLYFAVDRAVDGRVAYDRILRTRFREATTLLPSMSLAQQRSYMAKSVVPLWRYGLSAGHWHGPGDPAMAEVSASWLANVKGMQQEAQAAIAQLQAIDDPKAKPLADELRKVRQMLAKATQEPATPALEAERRKGIDQLELRQRELVTQLQRLGGRAGRGRNWAELDAIRNGLPAGGVLIDFAYVLVHDFKKKSVDAEIPRFLAFVTPPRGPVRVVDLGISGHIIPPVEALQKELAAAGQSIRQKGDLEAERILHGKARALAEKILDPLLALDEVKSAQHWIICPDSILWTVPWAALPMADGKYAVEKYPIRLVNAGRDVAFNVDRANTFATTGPLVVADPDFDLGRDAAARKARELTGGAAALDQNRSLLSAGMKLGGVQRLPNTATEADLVAPRIGDLLKQPPRVFTGDQALEAVVKSSRHPRMMVLSTHGFFLPSQGEDKSGRIFEEPLLRCGLLLAACNDQPKAGQTRPGDDGVLTGLEVVALDLRGCELVVLSACETGVSAVNIFEGVGAIDQVGVAGLRQAFQLAGAEAVLASLWQVPDRETAQLMIDFFARLSAGKDRPTALAEAQRELIKRRRERYAAAHPFFWAAFSLTGQDVGTLAALKTAKEYNERGNKFYSGNAYDLALADYDAAIKLDPAFPNAHNNRGLIFKLRGDLDQAIACYNKSIELDGKNVAFLRNRAHALRDRKQFAEALADFDQVVQIETTAQKVVDALLDRAHLHRLMGHHDKAKADGDAAEAKLPKYARVWLEKGIQAENAKQPDHAIKAYTTALECDAKSSFALYQRSRIHQSQQRPLDARQDLESAVVISPSYVAAWEDLARLRIRQKDFAGGAAAWREVVRLSPKSATARFNLGEELRLQGSYHEAIEHLGEAAKLDPKSATAWASRGAARRASGDATGAEEDYQKAIEINPKYAWVYGELGVLRIEQKRLDEAIAALDKAIDIDPKYVFAFNQRAKAHRLKGNETAAKADELKAQEAEFGSLGALATAAEYLARGNKLRLAGKSDLALADFDAALRLESTLAEAHYQRGWVLDRHKGALDPALAAYAKAISLDRQNATYLRTRADLYVYRKQHTEALADLATAIPLDAGVDALLDRAQLHRQMSKFDLAKADADAALAKAPRSARAWLERGMQGEKAADMDAAVAAYSKAIEFEPRNVLALQLRGIIFTNRQKLAEGRKDFEAALAIDPSHVGVRVNLGDVLVAAGDQEGAIAQRREVVRLVPKNAKARVDLAELLRRAYRHAEAIAQLDEAIKLDPKNAGAYAVRASAKLEQKDLAGTETDVLKALELSPKQAFALGTLGHLRLEQKRPDEAIAAVNQALAIEPNNAHSYDVRAAAYRLKGNEAAAAADKAKVQELLRGKSP